MTPDEKLRLARILELRDIRDEIDTIVWERIEALVLGKPLTSHDRVARI